MGREDELEQLGRALRGDSGCARIVVLAGEAGIGKTRLVSEISARQTDVQILAGSCLPLTESLAFGAVADALRPLADPSARAVLDRALAGCSPFVRPYVAKLIPALAKPSDVSDATSDRATLFAAIRDLMTGLCAEQRTAIVIDDLHWADPATLDLVTYLVHTVDLLVLVATVRREELLTGRTVADWVARVQRAPDAVVLEMGPLGRSHVASLVRDVLGSEPGVPFLAEVLRRGQGNPLFTEQLVTAAVGAGSPDKATIGLPPGLAPLFGSRIGAAGVAGRAVMAPLAVAERPLGEAELATAPASPQPLGPVLRALIGARLVTGPDDLGRYRLAHALLEEAVRDGLLRGERELLNRHVATVLAARPNATAPGEIAAHWAACGDVDQELRWTVRAAEHDEHVAAWREAGVAWKRVLALLDSASENTANTGLKRGEVVVRCADALASGGSPEEAERLCHEFLLAANPGDEIRARLLLRLGSLRAFRDDSESFALFEQSAALFERLGPSADKVRAMHNFSQAVAEVGDTERATRLLKEALELAPESGVRRETATIAVELAYQQLWSGDPEAALLALTRIWEESLALPAGAWGEADPAISLADALLVLGQFQNCVEVVLRAKSKLESDGLGDSLDHAILMSNGVEAFIHMGQVERARTLIPADLPEPSASCWPLYLSLATIDVRAGRVVDAAGRLAALRTLGLGSSLGRWFTTEVACAVRLAASDPQAAWDIGAATLPDLVGGGYSHRLDLLLTLVAQAAAEVVTLRRRVHPAVDQLQTWAETAGCFDVGPRHQLARARGAQFKAELARARLSDDDNLWLAAATAWFDLGSQHDEAYNRLRRAEVLLGSRRVHEAREELLTAVDLAVGHVPIRTQVMALARRAGIDLSARADLSRERADTQPDTSPRAALGLTARELSVLELLAQGMTNAQIAAALYMSPKTASVHVSAIIRKLRVTGRVQAATVAERTGLLGDNWQPERQGR